jgi:hypothetical protein
LPLASCPVTIRLTSKAMFSSVGLAFGAASRDGNP